MKSADFVFDKDKITKIRKIGLLYYLITVEEYYKQKENNKIDLKREDYPKQCNGNILGNVLRV